MTQPRSEILRDDWGIPHVWGATPADTLHGQGRACALDRAWQIEFMRLRAEGRTAEVFGTVAVEWDRFARRAGLHRSARAVYDKSSPRTRELLEAYSDGVNSALDEASAVELEELDHRPRPWQPWTPISVFLMHNILFGQFPNKLWRVQAARAFGRDGLRMFEFEGGVELSETMPGLPDEEFVDLVLAELAGGATGGGDGSVSSSSGSSTAAPGAPTPVGAPMATGAPTPAVAHGAAGSGSNAWGVTSARTATGAALIAGDPHRFLELPGLYVQCQLACPEFDVVGFAFAGVPGVPHFAHAGDVAWAITNAMGDYHDLYLERLTRTHDGVVAQSPEGTPQTTEDTAQSPECTAPAQVWTETIDVRGGEAVELEIIVTGNGPVVLGGVDEPHAISLRTPMLADVEGYGFDAALDLLFASTIDEVEQALTGWAEPVNRVVIADAAGEVRQHLVGAMPRRAPENYWLPVPGWDARFTWTGIDHGSVTDPATIGRASDHAVIANQRTHARPWLQPVTTETAGPARAERIEELLTGRDEVGLEDCTEIYRDVHLGAAAVLLDLVRRMDDLSALAERVRTRLLNWDQSMAAGSTDAWLFGSLRSRFIRALSGHEAMAALTAPHGFSSFLDPWFVPAPRMADGLAAVVTRLPGVDMARCLAACLDELAAETDGGERCLTWGDVHRFAPIHGFDLIGATPAHPEMSARIRPDPVPLGGDSDCVFANAAAVGFGDVCRLGSAARYVWDLAERDRSVWSVPMGAAGHPDSPHFQDQVSSWAVGDAVPVVSDWQRLRAGRPDPGARDRGGDLVAEATATVGEDR